MCRLNYDEYYLHIYTTNLYGTNPPKSKKPKFVKEKVQFT